MPSSDSVRRPIVAVKVLVLGVIGLLAACSASPVGERAAQSTATGCVTDAGLSPQDAEAGASLQRTVEAGPFYAAITGTADLASCRIGNDSGAATLDVQVQRWRVDARHARCPHRVQQP